MFVVKVGHIRIELIEIISVAVTVEPIVRRVLLAGWIMVAVTNDTIPGMVLTKVVPASVIVVTCGGKVTVEVVTMVEAGITEVTTDEKISLESKEAQEKSFLPSVPMLTIVAVSPN